MRIDSKNREIFDLIVPNHQLIEVLSSNFNWFSGVPDSMFTRIIPHLADYHFSPRENHAVAMAFGARIAGAKPCVLLQNSGLGLCLDALIGLQRLYQKGLVLLVTQRGELEWEEIQHQDWGKYTLPLLESINIQVFDYNQLGCDAIMKASDFAYTNEEICVVLLHRGNVDE
ncbi:MAG: hypothetical protein JXX29_23200 [Deltaproteobacteria bacterium]|nr:hypothetical protein [Deltaproteobacteria bacterium]MBN2674608.1 hypothetical protein [Deltaproteobacteria bacterium]